MNIRPTITINGVNSSTITGLIIATLPPISKPPKRVIIEEIDGRDGDIITELGFASYDKPLSFGLSENYNIDDVITFFEDKGQIVFSNEPDKIYNYSISEQIDFNKLCRYKTGEIILHVQPFKKLLNEEVIIFESGLSSNHNIYNSGNYFSRPVIQISGTGEIGLYINDIQQLTIELGETAETIIIDCEKMNAYDLDGVLLNRQVAGNYDNIKLLKGNNTIKATGNVSEIKISNYCRWI